MQRASRNGFDFDRTRYKSDGIFEVQMIEFQKRCLELR